MKENQICIGIVLKPHGIYGEIKASDLTDGFDAISHIKQIYLNDKPYKVVKIRNFGGYNYFTLFGISDRNTAESYRNFEIFVDRNDIKKSADEFFVVDVVGCDLFLSSGKKLGKIVDITSSKIDIYKAETLEGVAYFPMLKELNPIFDIENKKVTIDAKVFTRVVMYEN